MKPGHPPSESPRKLPSLVFVSLLALVILLVIIGVVALLLAGEEPRFVYEGFD